jgi:SAM-dependent methyltransferase
MMSSFRRTLLQTASGPYRSSGHFAWHFARSKLARDPVFAGLLAHGLIPDVSRLIDLGCGQGLLASWLRSAKELHDAGNWPSDWPAPPSIGTIFGLDLMPKDVERARRALDGCAEFAVGDIRTFDIGRTDIVVILDVLHYINYDEQAALLRRVRAVLTAGGLLITRVGDGAGGLPFHISQCVDRAVTFARGHRLPRLYCRSIENWMLVLEQTGFRADALPMSQHTPFANVLLSARV